MTLQSSMAVGDAFAYLAAFERAADWDPGVAEAQRLTTGPVDIGARFRIVSRVLGRTVPLEYRITRFESPTLVELSAESGTIRSVDTITFSPSAGGSQVTYRADLRLKGAIGRVADPVLGRLLSRIGRRAAAGLQRALNP